MTNKQKLDPYDVVLDEEEKDIEESLNFNTIKPVKNVKSKITALKKIASQYRRRHEEINIKITHSDLLRLKEAAADEGLPYDILIASVLHKYAVGQTIHR